MSASSEVCCLYSGHVFIARVFLLKILFDFATLIFSVIPLSHTVITLHHKAIVLFSIWHDSNDYAFE